MSRKFVTLKDIMTDPSKNNSEPRCFLCASEIDVTQPHVAIKLDDTTAAAFHGNCDEVLHKILSAFIKDTLKYYFFEGGLEVLAQDKIWTIL